MQTCVRKASLATQKWLVSLWLRHESHNDNLHCQDSSDLTLCFCVYNCAQLSVSMHMCVCASVCACASVVCACVAMPVFECVYLSFLCVQPSFLSARCPSQCVLHNVRLYVLEYLRMSRSVSMCLSGLFHLTATEWLHTIHKCLRVRGKFHEVLTLAPLPLLWVILGLR